MYDYASINDVNGKVGGIRYFRKKVLKRHAKVKKVKRIHRLNFNRFNNNSKSESV